MQAVKLTVINSLTSIFDGIDKSQLNAAKVILQALNYNVSQYELVYLKRPNRVILRGITGVNATFNPYWRSTFDPTECISSQILFKVTFGLAQKANEPGSITALIYHLKFCFYA